MLGTSSPIGQNLDKLLSNIPPSARSQWLHNKRTPDDIPRHQNSIEEFSELEEDNSDSSLQMESIQLQDQPIQSGEEHSGSWFDTLLGWGKRSTKPVSNF